MNDTTTPTWMRGPELRAALARFEIAAMAADARWTIEVAAKTPRFTAARALDIIRCGYARDTALSQYARALEHYADQRWRLEHGEPEPKSTSVVLTFNNTDDAKWLRMALEQVADRGWTPIHVPGPGENDTLH